MPPVFLDQIGDRPPCLDFGSAQRVTAGQSREPRQRRAKRGPEGPTLTARRHARPSCRVVARGSRSTTSFVYFVRRRRVRYWPSGSTVADMSTTSNPNNGRV